MKNIVRFSIKWKLATALILTGLLFIVSYVVLAKKVFEDDKISYVFDAQAYQLDYKKEQFQELSQRAIWNARAIISSIDQQQGGLNSTGKSLYDSEKSILALELVNVTKNQSLVRLEKSANELPLENSVPEDATKNELVYKILKNDKLLLTLKYLQTGSSEAYRMRVIVDFGDLMKNINVNQNFLILQNGIVVGQSDNGTNFDFSSLALELNGNRNENDKTLMWGTEKSKFLVSYSPTGYNGISILLITPESVALGALSILFKKSIIFLFLSAFGLVIIALYFSRGLTRNITKLTTAAEKIGAGDFNSVPQMDSKDEVALLANSMQTMSTEIVRLLDETKDKARMEEELKTASLVQESLLPRNPHFHLNQLEIYGEIISSSECSGDWWYYFTKGEDIYVIAADATGHGTPAALITAAARSVFSRLEQENLSLPDMLRAWDNAVLSCSKGRICMTGIICKINSVSGLIEYVSAGHEAPYLIEKEGEEFSSQFLDLIRNNSIGEGLFDQIEVQKSQMPKGSFLVIYTDGLFAVEAQDGKKLSERRLGKKMADFAPNVADSEQMNQFVLTQFNDHRKNLLVPDDVTLISIKFCA